MTLDDIADNAKVLLTELDEAGEPFPATMLFYDGTELRGMVALRGWTDEDDDRLKALGEAAMLMRWLGATQVVFVAAAFISDPAPILPRDNPEAEEALLVVGAGQEGGVQVVYHRGDNGTLTFDEPVRLRDTGATGQVLRLFSKAPTPDDWHKTLAERGHEVAELKRL